MRRPVLYCLIVYQGSFIDEGDGTLNPNAQELWGTES